MSFLPRTLASLGVIGVALCAPTHGQTPSGSVAGRVVDASGTPLADVVVFMAEGEGSSVRSDATGAFRLLRVEAGLHLLNLRRAGFAPGTVPVEVEDVAVDVGVIRMLAGPDPTATVSGRVTDSGGGRPVAGALVVVNGRTLGETDADGRFASPGLAVSWGPNRLEVRHLSYADLVSDFWIGEPDEAVHFPVALTPSPLALPGVVVTGASTPEVPFVLRGFTERRMTTNGYFLDRAEIEQRNPTGVVALLRDVPGVRVRSQPEGTEVLFSRRSATFSQARECRSPLIFVDGILVEGELTGVPVVEGAGSFVDIDGIVDPDQIAGLEAYNGASTVPAIFNRLGSACGVLAIWTIRYAMSSQALDAPVAGAAPGVGPQLMPSPSRGRRNLVIGAIVVPAVIIGLRAAICSMPHYCR